MNRPFELVLPTSFEMGQLIGVQSTLLGALGWDLGMKYDSHMRAVAGEDWLEELRVERWQHTSMDKYKYKLTLTDPSFAVTEPLKDRRSVLRACLPSTPEFYDTLNAAWKIRNEAQHYDPPLNAGLLKHRVKVIGKLAYLAGLPLAHECKTLLDRMNKIDQGGLIKLVPAAEAAELQQGLTVEREKGEALALEIDTLREQVRAAKSGVSGGTDFAVKLEALKLKLRKAEASEKLAKDALVATEAALHRSNAEARETSDAWVSGIRPGDAWPAVPGSRILRLMPHVLDFYDPTGGILLSDSVGSAAIQAARRWRPFIPYGGVVHLNGAGQASALIGATYVYLGSLDEFARNDDYGLALEQTDADQAVMSDEVAEERDSSPSACRCGTNPSCSSKAT